MREPRVAFMPHATASAEHTWALASPFRNRKKHDGIHITSITSITSMRRHAS